MAQTYKQIFKDSLETQYASGIAPLISLSQINQSIVMTPVAIEGHGTANTTDQVVIQRFKRLKAADSKLTDGPNKTGTDYIARLDTAQRVSWETIATKATVKRDLFVEIPMNLEYDPLQNAGPYFKVIGNITKNHLIELEEEATKALWVGASSNTDKLAWDGTVASAQTLANTIMDKVEALQMKVDDFKAYSTTMVVIVHPRIARAFASLQGQGYELGTNTFPEGFQGSFTYNHVEFYVSKIINTIDGAAATEVGGAIVMDRESFAATGPAFNYQEVDDKAIDVRVMGHTYGWINIVIDPSRIFAYEMTLPAGAAKSKTVNE